MHPPRDRLKALSSPLSIGIVGVGSIGRGLAYQVSRTPGMRPVALADTHVERAIACARWLGVPHCVVSSRPGFEEALCAGATAICEDGELLASSGRMDLMIESSSAVYEGALHAQAALRSGMHVVMMNYEADLMYGPWLMQVARGVGKVYTCADGDQPAAIKRLIDDIELWGFDIVMGGNIKGFLDRYTDPERILAEAKRRGLDPKMCSAYTDGSKLSVEMAVLANAIGARASVPGMHGPRITDIADVFGAMDFAGMWRPGDPPIVDYVLGAKPRGGVFVIAHTDEQFQRFTLDWFPPDMGPGPFYVFSRPYHLGHIEAMNCVVEACLDGTARLQPRAGMRANVFSYAKRDLNAGDTLDGMGGFATYGQIENLADAARHPGLPQLLSEGVRLKRPVRQDGRIDLADCEFDPATPAWALYRSALDAVPS